MATIRLLHISDPHISRFLNVRQLAKHMSLRAAVSSFTFAPKYSRKRLVRFLSFLGTRRGTLDGIIMTGDIATTGRIFDLEKAFDTVKNRIKPIGVDLGLLPGNHDRWVPYRKGYDSAIFSLGYDPGGKDFHHLFSDFWGPGDVRTFRFRNDKFRVDVIAADLSLKRSKDAEIPKLINKHGQGRVYEGILKELETATVKAMNDAEFATVVLWAIHFPPYCPDIASNLRLIYEKNLIEKAEELGVPIILAGHSHVPRAYPIPTYELRVFCAGSLCEYNQARNNFFIITIETLGNDYSVQLENYEFDGFRRRFVRRALAFG